MRWSGSCVTVLEYLLDGLEAELALERELGVRVVECDRALLVGNAGRGIGEEGKGKREEGTAAKATAVESGNRVERPRLPSNVSRPDTPVPTATPPHPNSSTCPFLFIHDRPLSSKGAEIVAKITEALGETAESAPVVFEPPFPKAKVTVILGARALRKWFPACNGSPGQWIAVQNGEEALVSYSPEYVLRLTPGGEQLKNIKRKMWTDLKAAHRKAKGVTS